jgi:hypothetical protein
VLFYFHKDFFSSFPGDFSGGILRRLSACGHPSLPAFQPPTPPGAVMDVIIHFSAWLVKHKSACCGEIKPRQQASFIFGWRHLPAQPGQCPRHLQSLGGSAFAQPHFWRTVKV